MPSFEEIKDLVGFNSYYEEEERYATSLDQLPSTRGEWKSSYIKSALLVSRVLHKAMALGFSFVIYTSEFSFRLAPTIHSCFPSFLNNVVLIYILIQYSTSTNVYEGKVLLLIIESVTSWKFRVWNLCHFPRRTSKNPEFFCVSVDGGCWIFAVCMLLETMLYDLIRMMLNTWW